MKVSVHKIEKIEQKFRGEKIILFGRNSKGKQITINCTGHKPYFYVLDDISIPYHEKVVSKKRGFKSYSGEELVRLITMNSNDVPSVRKLFREKECYEDDVLYVDRFAIDTGIKNGIEVSEINDVHYSEIKPINFYVPPRRLHIDIEVLMDFNRLPQYSNAIRRITSISCYDNYTKTITTFTNRPIKGSKEHKWKGRKIGKTSVLYSDEKSTERVDVTELETDVGTKYKWRRIYYNVDVLVEYEDEHLKKKFSSEKVEFTMLSRFLDYYNKVSPDFFCGWNIKGFDLPYLVYRMKKLGLDYKRFSPIRKVMINEKQAYLDLINIKGVVIFDTMDSYKKLHTHKISGKLNDAANVKLGYGKVSYSGSLDNLYETDEETFLKYNAVDVVMEYEVFDKLKMMDYYSGLRRFIGVPYEDMGQNSRVIDFYFLSKAKEAGIVLPSARENKRLAKLLKPDEAGFSGAHVPIPIVIGRTMNVLTIDLKSLYPMIMLTWNLGNDTIVRELGGYDKADLIETPPINGKLRYFLKDKLSFISKCLKELVEYRDNLKKQLYEMKKYKEEKGYTDIEIEVLNNIQIVVKFLTNTIYGVLGMPKYRLFNLIIAECITTIGRMILIDSINYINKLKILIFILKVLGGDTDSAHIQLIDKLEKIKSINKKDAQIFLDIFEERCPEEDKHKFNYSLKVLIGLSYQITDELNVYYNKYKEEFNFDNNYLLIKPEDISSVFFTVRLKGGKRAAKKRYAKKKMVEFLQDKPIKVDEIDIKGFKKSNLSIVGNKIVENVMDLICVDKSNEELEKEVADYLREEIAKILKMEYPITDICRRVGMNKKINTYRNEEHVRAARWTNEYASVWDGISNHDAGSIVKYIFVDSSRMFREYARGDVVALDDNNYLPEKFNQIIDFNKLINKTVLEPLSEVLDGLGVEYNYIRTGKKAKKMF